MLKQDLHVFTGMQRDSAISKQKAEFLWDAKNIRLTARDKDTLLALTSEKGTTRLLEGKEIKGTYLGHAVLGDFLVIFTTLSKGGERKDYIYRVDKEGTSYILNTLYEGDLNFNINHPIETLSYYETEYIQKVYWVDGLNQSRVINIVKERLEDDYNHQDFHKITELIEKIKNQYSNKETPFDFVQQIKLTEKVEVYKQYNSNGLFPSGVVQYAFTYYNKYGSETNIVHITPLFYNTYENRAGSPEDKMSLFYKLIISNVDASFDYIRVYSIIRTSLNATPTVKIIGDYDTKNITNIIDPYNPTFTVELVDSPFPTGTIYDYMADQVKLYSDVGCTNPLGSMLDLTSKDERVITFYIDSLYGIFNTPDSMYLKYNNTVYKINQNTIQLTRGASIITLDSTIKWNKVTLTASKKGIVIVDNNTTGEVVDPTLLLYIGGEQIAANTLTQKDSTLFLGNYTLLRYPVTSTIKNSLKSLKINITTRNIKPTNIDYRGLYFSSLSSIDDKHTLQSPIGFKGGETYRFGVQFQHKSGRWSEPCFIKDTLITEYPRIEGNNPTDISIPSAQCIIPVELSDKIFEKDYVRARAIMVLPSYQDRSILAQGVVTPTVFNANERINKGIHAQSSWFFRPYAGNTTTEVHSIEHRHLFTLQGDKSNYSEIEGITILGGTEIFESGYPISRFSSEVDAVEKGNNIFAVDQSIITFHSPDIELTEDLWNIDLSNIKAQLVGVAYKTDYTYGDLNVQTKTPPIQGRGFHKPNYGITSRELYSDFLYEDYLIDDWSNSDGVTYHPLKSPNTVNYKIYPWQSSGSLNNDIKRPESKGTRTAVLLKKKLSNIKYFNTKYKTITTPIIINQAILHKTEQTEVYKIKVGIESKNYYGNIDTMLNSDSPYSSVFTFNPDPHLFRLDNTYIYSSPGIFGYNTGGIYSLTEDRVLEGLSSFYNAVGDHDKSLRISKDPIRMKYKSSPHIVLSLKEPLSYKETNVKDYLYIVDLYKDTTNRYGGDSENAIKNNLWIPCGDIVPLDEERDTLIEFKYGDTFYQRYDCLKTYPFTLEDENSVIEIGSFVLENRVNVEGRYDRNKGLQSNLYVHATNFNKMNPVYKQANTFFNYRVLDEDFYKQSKFDTSLTWSLQKKAGDNIDLWTKVTLANVLDLNGEKGKIVKLTTLNDNLIAFQDRAINQILFNSRVQIPASDGLPIEISNNYKVDGSRYISDSIGCIGRESVTHSNNGLYFIDSISKGLYNISNGLVPISDTHGMSSWFLHNANLQTYSKLFYDYNYNDVYVNTPDTTLGFSEVLGQFTSFYDYQQAVAMFNIGSDFYSIKSNKDNCELYSMFTNNSTNIFNVNRDVSITFISNADSVVNKTFTNIDIRADLYDGNTLSIKPKLFDTVQVTNEYQDTGTVPLNFTNIKPSNLKKKFRVWRLNIPRDKTYVFDRISNTWAKVKLTINSNTDNLVLHDLNVNYHI